VRLEFHPAVQRDLSDALDYYRTEGGPNLSERFEKEFRACLSAIRAAPARFPFYLGSETLRRIRLSNFPYIIVYRERSEVVRVTVLKHEKRHPRFGMRRR
jgi:toxin ParE1/3/4